MEFDEIKKTIPMHSACFARINGEWRHVIRGTIVPRKGYVICQLGNPRPDENETVYAMPDNIRPNTPEAVKGIYAQMGEEKLKAREFYLGYSMKELNNCVERYLAVVKVFKGKFETAPAYTVTRYADDVIQTEYAWKNARRCLDAIERGMELIPALRELVDDLKHDQMRYHGCESTSKMSIFEEEEQAKMRIRMIEQFDGYLRAFDENEKPFKHEIH